MTLKDFKKIKVDSIEECNNKILDAFKNLSIKDQLLYDFTTEYNDNYDNIENAIERFLKYRVVVGLKKQLKVAIDEDWFTKYKGLVDPDSNSLFLRIFYYKLWGKNTYTTGDTMTSAATPFTKFLNLFFKEELNQDPNPKGWTTLYCANKYEILKTKITKDNEYKDIYNFIMLNHTLGNFISVPENFNFNRSNSGENDNWFLTFSMIKKYFDNNKKEKYLEELLQHNNITATVEWLDSYKKTEEFVEKYFLQDYEEYKIDNFTWEKHKITKNNWKNFFETMCKVIMLRSLRMLIEINDDDKKKDECRKLIIRIKEEGYEKVLTELK